MDKLKYFMILLLLLCGCENHEKVINDSENEIITKIEDDNNKEESKIDLDKSNELFNDTSEEEITTNQETIVETSSDNKQSTSNKKQESSKKETSDKSDEKNNKDSSSAGNEQTIETDETENVDKSVSESTNNNHEMEDEQSKEPITQEEEKVHICSEHKWDDSHGNKPQFSELIFDDWSECDRVMNDIYNNFVTEEKLEYNKYYQNSKGQWMSSILASDVWCECGAHAYAIFITYE